MTTKEHIIFFSILFSLIIGIAAVLYIGKYMSGDKFPVDHIMLSQDNETHKENKSMIETYTTIIIALGTPTAMIGVLLAIPTYLEKMRKYRIDKLKDRMIVLFTEGWDHQRVHTPETLKEFYKALGHKFQKKRYNKLHQTAFDELGREGKNPIWSLWDLKRQMIEKQMMHRVEAAMLGPDGMIYRSGGRIIRESDEDKDEGSDA